MHKIVCGLLVLICPLVFSAPVVSVTPVTTKVSHQMVQVIGEIRAKRDVTIKAAVPGHIKAVYIESNQHVSANEKLYQIDPQGLEQELEHAKAVEELTHTRYDEFKTLVKRQFSSRDQFLEAKANYHAARAKVANLEHRLGLTLVRAPFAGKLGLKMAYLGDYVDIGQPLIHINDDQEMRLDFSVAETDAALLKLGDTIHFSLTAFPKQNFTAKIYALNNLLSQSSRVLAARALIDKSEQKLLTGQSGVVKVAVPEKEQSLFVPVTAIVYASTNTSVYRVDQNNKVHLVEVKLGEQQGNEIQVLSGLQPTDRVVSEGHIKLTDGSQVTIAKE
ncbi:MAG: efflux RND transporter periplasmic adaptor subunit [Legionellales bacterium]|nr:efflux RND transporter periplasmic adaptor subunit [Legionellales bacterium]